MFARGCDEGFEVSIQDEWDRKHEFCRISKCCDLFWDTRRVVRDADCIREDDLETMLVTEWMQAVRTNKGLSIKMCPVTYETRKTCDQGVMKFVSFGQQQ